MFCLFPIVFGPSIRWPNLLLFLCFSFASSPYRNNFRAKKAMNGRKKKFKKMSSILNQNEENTKKVNSSINQENALFGEECEQQEKRCFPARCPINKIFF
uniref:Secreted protein n=1 Tax=Meloidogyne incognita TaxID=6306 RepID=A0A914N2B0_MELIC